jgi:molecular chaperone GrpE
MEENQTFTQEQVNELLQQEKTKWESDVLNPLQQELLQYMPVEKSDAEKALELKQAELWQKEVSLTLKSEGLVAFSDFFNANDSDELSAKVTKFKQIINDMKIDNSYKPSEHKSTDKYSQHEKSGNVVGMIETKLASLFK